MISQLRSLLLALLLCVPAAVAADSHLSSDPAVEKARTLYSTGQYEQALSVLGTLDPDHPDRIDVLFLTGLAAIGAAERREDEAEREALLDGAIAALRDVLIERPELLRVRLELARAFFLKGDDDLAREHFTRVLAGRPHPVVVANIQRFLAEIRARKRWSFRAGFAIAPDSNLGGTSEEEVIYINDLPFQRDIDTDARSGVGVIAWGGAEYQHPLGERMRLRAGGDVVQREYAGSDFDRTAVSLHLGPRFLIGPATEASLLATASREWSAGQPTNDTLGSRLELTRRLSRRVTANVHASWLERDYRTSDSRDGPLTSLSLGGTWVATPTVQVNGSIGYSRDRPETEVWRNASRRVRAGVTVALPYGFTVSGSGEYRRTDYEGSWFPFVRDGSGREDRTRVVRLSLLNRAITVFGFSPQIALVHERRDTNAQLYDYERTRGELRLQRLF